MTRHAAITLLIPLSVLALLLWLVPGPVLTLFGGILCGIALRAAALPVARRLGLARSWSVLLVTLVLLALLGLGAWLVASTLMAEWQQLAADLPRGWEDVRRRIRELPAGPFILDNAPRLGFGGNPADLALTGFGSTFGALGTALLILLIGVYLAAEPEPYQRGFLRLLDPSLRPRAEATLDAVGESLRGWLLGQGFAMVVTGILTWLGLLWLGLPLAGVLSVLTALFGFVPYLGPLIGMVPAVLIALVQDASLIPWIIALFLIVQNVEGNILTPLVQQRSADLPPALLLGAQALFGTGLGFLGILLAAPVAAALLAAVRTAYVEGWIEHRPVQPPALLARRLPEAAGTRPTDPTP